MIKKGVVDLGNTRIKVGVFNEIGELLETKVLKNINEVQQYFQENGVINVLVSSTRKVDLRELEPIGYKELTHKLKMPFINVYQTPETLGADRYALMAAANNKFPKQSVLVFDFGTCITIDFLDADNTYYGGNISLGLEMRLKAMHEFTEKLPLSNMSHFKKIMGHNTNSALASGAFMGIKMEIEGYIKHFSEKDKQLKIVFTGGDMKSFDLQEKYKIFADPNFVLKGLFAIIKINEN